MVVWHRPQHRKIVQYLAENGAEYDIFTAARAGLLDAVRHMLKEYPNLVNTPEIIAITRRYSVHHSSTALVKKPKPLWIIYSRKAQKLTFLPHRISEC